MLLTVTNLTAAPLEVGFPINKTLAASGDPGDSVELGVSEADLEEGNQQGDPAYKRLNLMRQEGKISMAIAADAANSSILDEANEV